METETTGAVCQREGIHCDVEAGTTARMEPLSVVIFLNCTRPRHVKHNVHITANVLDKIADGKKHVLACSSFSLRGLVTLLNANFYFRTSRAKRVLLSSAFTNIIILRAEKTSSLFSLPLPALCFLSVN